MKRCPQQLAWFGIALALATLAGCGGGGGGDTDTIVRVSRQNNSGTYHYFREAVLGADREFKLGSIDLSGSKDVVEMVAKTPNAIGYSGLGYATDEVNLVPVSSADGEAAVPPTPENALNKTYPLARPLYLYSIGEPSGAIKHFIEWVYSREGQAVVTDIGYISLGSKEPTESAAPPDGEIKIAGSDTMVNVAQRWAEVYTGKFPNVNVQVSGGGSGTGIKALIDGTIQIATSSREMKDEERGTVAAKGQGEVREDTVGLDALAIYVHKSNAIASISLKQLAEIFGDGGTITRWSQLQGGAASGN